MRLAAAIALAMLALPVHAASAALPGLNGKIAFHSHPEMSEDIFVVNPNGSGRTAITGPPAHERDPAWSPDGTKIAFVIDGDIFVMNADGSGRVNLTPGGVGQDEGPAWSPDGSQLVFSSSRSAAGVKIYKMDADGSDVTQVTTDAFSFDRQPAWSPDGQQIAFTRGERIYTVRPDGTDITPVTPAGVRGISPDWAPNGWRIAYEFLPPDGPPWATIHTIEPDGSNDVDLGGMFPDSASRPAWSPDSREIAFNGGGSIWRMNADGTGSAVLVTQQVNGGPDWQPLPFPGYPRARSASPMRISLVPAYGDCAAPNRTHGPPLSFGSCNPPAQTSPLLTVGTPDANGAAANSIGSLRMWVAVGPAGPPSDTQVWIDDLAISDVRCTGATTTCGNANTAGGPDYAGELEGRFTFQGTDKNNGPNRDEPATMTDYTFHWRVPCTSTADPSTGSVCSHPRLSMDAVVPGIVLNLEGKRAMWEIEGLGFYDGGGDGDAETLGDNSLFVTQGVFIP